MRWLLPDHIQDVLPPEAEQLESLRRNFLDVFQLHGYQLVMPPMLEFLDSLTIGAGRDLNLRTFKLVDQVSGKSLGMRADMTPQVTRIDAHLLNRSGVSRLCYCGSVLHALPSSLLASREPLQLGAEIYGHAGIEADIEILCLLAKILDLANVPAPRIDISHVGLFHALASQARLSDSDKEKLFTKLQNKDIPGLKSLLEKVPEPVKSALLALPDLYGGRRVLEDAERLMPKTVEIATAFSDLKVLAQSLSGLPLSFDLADLRGYHYHSGVVFAAYGGQSPSALAFGGRYDHLGEAFGKARPATGFSLYLRELIGYQAPSAKKGSILAPCVHDDDLARKIDSLRRQKEIVVLALPGHEGSWTEAGCDRQLIKRNEVWQVEPLGLE